jgi:hypothetical protein
MSKILRGSLVAIAVTGTLGVAQLAVGGDLGQLGPNMSTASATTTSSQTTTSAQDVNRGGKADRAVTTQQMQPGQTFGVTLVGQSVLVRVPDELVGQATRAPAPQPVGPRRSMVACEPVVSVLTEVAKQLQPGRCVT